MHQSEGYTFQILPNFLTNNELPLGGVETSSFPSKVIYQAVFRDYVINFFNSFAKLVIECAWLYLASKRIYLSFHF